jgi:hypothetical protein
MVNPIYVDNMVRKGVGRVWMVKGIIREAMAIRQLSILCSEAVGKLTVSSSA